MSNKMERKTMPRDEFFAWLDHGETPLSLCDGSSRHILLKMPKTDEVEYIFDQYSYRTEGLSWDDPFDFCGAYDRRSKCIYIDRGKSFPSVVDGLLESETCDIGKLRKSLTGKVNTLVEGRIANDRNNLSIHEIRDVRLKKDLADYLEYGVKNSVIARFFQGETSASIRFQSRYKAPEWTEEALLRYIQAPAAFVQAEADSYIDRNQEKFLMQFLTNEADVRELRAIEADPDGPIQRQKRLTDAIKQCGAKTVTVTVQKGGQELSFKTSASSLTGHHTSYSTWDVPAPDRRRFEEMFGRYSDFKIEDITTVAYGRKTIYEAPPRDLVQEELPAQGMTMGGM